MVEGTHRYEPQEFFGVGDVGPGVADVARPRLFVYGGDVHLEDLSQFMKQLMEVYPPAAGHVENLSRRILRSACQEVCPDDVIDEDEVPRLVAVTIDGWLSAAKEGSDEFRDDGGVFRSGVLPWSEHVEVAQGDRVQVVEFGEEPAVFLADDFAHGIGGEGRRFRLFREGPVIFFPVPA